MSKVRRFILPAVALVAIAVVTADGRAGEWLGGLLGPRVTLEVSGQLGGAGSGGTPPLRPVDRAPAALDDAGVAAAAAKVVTTVAVEPAAKQAKGYAIEARLVGRDGKGVADTEVAFFDVVELFGVREMLIGVATTDGFGLATVDYLPVRGGEHRIVARPTQWDRLAATQATTLFRADRVAPAAYARERLPLDTFSPSLPYAGAALLAAVWGLFAFVVIGSLYRMPRGAPRAASASRPSRSRQL